MKMIVSLADRVAWEYRINALVAGVFQPVLCHIMRTWVAELLKEQPDMPNQVIRDRIVQAFSDHTDSYLTDEMIAALRR